MKFAMLGISVFGAEVDDRGIDFVVRTDEGMHYDVQLRSPEHNFFPKSTFTPSPSLLAALVQGLERSTASPCAITHAGNCDADARE
ncbi:MAG: hypothetical protein AB7G88_08525 [Thermomicrobiales bacterium]